MNKKKIALCVLATGMTVSISAAIYSIIGLSKLFSGAVTAVMIMATTLEFSKIIITSVLKLYWKDINLKLKIYLIPATIILMLITSMGIYGFLTAAYQDVYNKNEMYEIKLKSLNDKINTFSENNNVFKIEKENLITSIKSLSDNLNVSNQSVDKKTGQLIIQSNNQSQKRIDNQITKYSQKIDLIDLNLKINNDSINKILSEKETLYAESSAVAELGPLKYIAKITNVDIDIVVNYLILIIIFVFDPLAIAMLILGLELLKTNPLKRKHIKVTESKIEEIPDNFGDNYGYTDILDNDSIDEIKEDEIEPVEEDIQEEITELPTTQAFDDLIDETFNLTPDKRKNLPHEMTRKIELKNNLK